jgi:dUTP pyrophosphatase
MKVKKLLKYAGLPQKAHAGDLGYDLFAAEYATIQRGETKLISTGIAIQLPEGYGAIIRDRSSVATKRNLFVVAGVIDNGYTGEIKVALYSTSDKFEQIREGDKIAQLILIPTVDFKVEEVSELESLDGRGEKGFGSTGT